MEQINPETPEKKVKKISFFKNFFKALVFSILIIAVALLLSYQFKDTEPLSYNQIEDDVNVESSINSYMEGNNLIIEYTNPNKERVWIEGLSNDRYLINEYEIIIYDYQQSERFELHIGEDSDIYGFGRLIGYEFLDNGSVVHMWNTQDNYYFEKDSGIQLTNHYEDYWTRNIFCIGYYSGGTWNKIKCSDELTGFNKQIQTDNETFIEAILWKDIQYQEYDLRFGVNYTLRLDDKNLSIGIYMKNIGVDIPFDLGFAWRIKDWEIPHEGVGGDSIYINGTDYRLDGNFDLTFRDMQHSYFDEEINQTIIEYDSFLRAYDWKEFLRIDWNENLNYAVKMFGDGNQENFYVSILINAGHFNPNQEKSTTFKWIDALGDYTGVHWDTAGDGAGSTRGIESNETHTFVVDSTDDEVYIFLNDGDFQTSWDTGAGRDDPGGITKAHGFTYVLDDDDESLNNFSNDGTFIESFSVSGLLGSTSGFLNGLTNNGTFFWITDGDNDLVHKIYINGTPTGESFGISLVGLGTGITYILLDGLDTLWIVDKGGSDAVYKYFTNGTYSGFNFGTDSSNGSPDAISSDSYSFWITDIADDEVYKYEIIPIPDTTHPTFTTIPDNQSIFYFNESLNVTFVGTDETGFSGYTINDTDNFQIGFDSGFLINNTPFGVGNYAVNVTINDTSKNINWTIFTLEVSQSLDNCQVLFNETSPHENSSAFSVYTDCSSEFQLYRNGSVILNNSQQYPLDEGIYNYSVFRNDTINYSNIFDDEWFTLTSPCIEVLVNTSFSDWTNVSCISGDLMNESRFLTQFDSNVCGVANETFYEYKAEVYCDYCTPNLDYYYGSWGNLNCPHSELWNQSRETTYYDSNVCGEISNVSSYEYREYGICEYTGPFVATYYNTPTNEQNRDLLGIFSFVSQETQGLFFPIMLVVLFCIQLIGSLASGSSGAKAWVSAGFICTILSIPLGILAFVAQKYIYLLIIVTALGVFWLKLASSKE